jgi:hypothetical protein
LIQEFAESERLEQLTAEKRRLKILEYRRTVSEMLEERRQRREEELQQLQRMHDLEVEDQKARYLIIQCKMTLDLLISSYVISNLNVEMRLCIQQRIIIV